MALNNYEVNADPDYESNNSVLRQLLIKEKNENREHNAENLRQIISEQFDQDLALREKQLVDIEEIITRAQKLLHLVRYALITSYYNKKNLQYTSTNEDDSKSLFDKQNRIHPAIKKLLGNNPTSEIFNVYGKRKAASKVSSSEASTSQTQPTKKIKTEAVEDTSKTQPLDSNQNCLQNRKRIKHRLVVGNISKYMPSLEDDQTTHKWMIYVRGDKNKPDISDIVEKVVFYLHPSYKPHDVVEVKSPPFHLSRRGWGEFPLRVQIYFVCALNKPIDIIHNLKLDKTLTGRQMLGNENLVDVFLHENAQNVEVPPTESESLTDLPSLNSEIKIEKVDYDEIIDDYCLLGADQKEDYDNMLLALSDDLQSPNPFMLCAENNLEHDYCQDEYLYGSKEQEIGNNYYLEHSYCIPADQEGVHNIKKHKVVEYVEDDHNILKYGLGPSYLENRCQIKTSRKIQTPTRPLTLSQPIKILPSNMNQLLLSNGQTIQLKVLKPQQPQVKVILAGSLDGSLDTTGQLVSGKKNSMLLPDTAVPLTDKTFNDWSKKISDRSISHDASEKEQQLLLEALLRVTSIQKPFDNSIFSQIWNLVIKKIDQELQQYYFVNMQENTFMLRHDSVEKRHLYLPIDKFTNLGQALPYIFRRLPLWLEKHSEQDLRENYPFIASSREEYESWNIGRKLSSEWNRAKEVKKLIAQEKFPLHESWTTKTYFTYARSHGFSPIIKRPLLSTREGLMDYARICFIFNPSIPSPTSFQKQILPDMDVNIDSDINEDTMKSKSCILMVDQTTKHHCTFVREAARDCGIVLKPEEIVDGVRMNAAERIILEAVKCLADNLIRRANFFLTCEKTYSEDSIISTSQITKAIKEREEMSAISEFQAGKKMREFYS